MTTAADKWNLEPYAFNSMTPIEQDCALGAFSDFIWLFYGAQKRNFPWRDTKDPYNILLSEMMLQQTQTSRVLPKYLLFIETWPNFQALSNAPLTDILKYWQGLGYNRRALAFSEIAKKCEAFGWTLPPDQQKLQTLPMVGPATSAAILAFAYNRQSIYLETNIRRVLIHQFFNEEEQVSDRQLKDLLFRMVQLQSDYRNWYYALMDYGAYLARLLPNPNRRSLHYKKQGEFKNSNRQIRGLLLTVFTEQGPVTKQQLYHQLPFEDERIDSCIEALLKEKFIARRSKMSVAEKDIRYGIVADE